PSAALGGLGRIARVPYGVQGRRILTRIWRSGRGRIGREERRAWIQCPRPLERRPGVGDRARAGGEACRDEPEAPVVAVARDRLRDLGPRRRLAPRELADERELQVRRGGPRLDVAGLERRGARPGEVAAPGGRLARPRLDRGEERDRLAGDERKGDSGNRGSPGEPEPA